MRASATAKWDWYKLGRRTALLAALAAVLLWRAKQLREIERDRRKKQRALETGLPGSRERKEQLCAKFDLDPQGGFIPLDGVKRLPSPLFDEWEELVANLAVLNFTGQTRQAIADMREIYFEGTLQKDRRLLQRAYIVLGFLLHSFVNGDDIPWIQGPNPLDLKLGAWGPKPEIVPPQLARPLVYVCDQLGLPVTLTSAGFDQWNWQRSDGTNALGCVSNMMPISKATFEPAEDWFHIIPSAMSHAAGRDGIVFDVFDMDVAIRENQTKVLMNLLLRIKQLCEEFVGIFASMHDLVPVESFLRYRHFLSEIKIDLDLGDRIQHVEHKGVSGAQTAIIMLFDIALGIDHKNPALDFQKEMLGYVPGKNRAFLRELRLKCEKHGSLRQFNQHPVLGPYLEACIGAFRRTAGSDFKDLLRQGVFDTTTSLLAGDVSNDLDV